MPLITTQQPRFTHTECDTCFFVAHIDVEGEKPHDLWLCRPEDFTKSDGFNESLLLRYGDDGPDYFSGPPKMWIPIVLRRLLLPESEPAPYPALVAGLRELFRLGLIH